MAQIIDIRSRLKTSSEPSKGETEAAPIVDIAKMRDEALNKERRDVRRTILTEFIAVHTVVPGAGLLKVALYNINENGVAFDIEEKAGHFQVGEEIAMRVYLNHQTYFPFVVKIRHMTELSDEGVFRHGAEFVKGTINDEALHHFVKFIETVSAAFKADGGDLLVSKIGLT